MNLPSTTLSKLPPQDRATKVMEDFKQLLKGTSGNDAGKFPTNQVQKVINGSSK